MDRIDGDGDGNIAVLGELESAVRARVVLGLLRIPRVARIGDAVALRTRPILLTTGTTVAGLMPLAFSETSLWPPLAWAMITGLLASTLLTLLVVPALYRLLFRDAPDHAAIAIAPSARG